MGGRGGNYHGAGGGRAAQSSDGQFVENGLFNPVTAARAIDSDGAITVEAPAPISTTFNQSTFVQDFDNDHAYIEALDNLKVQILNMPFNSYDDEISFYRQALSTVTAIEPKYQERADYAAQVVNSDRTNATPEDHRRHRVASADKLRLDALVRDTRDALNFAIYQKDNDD